MPLVDITNPDTIKFLVECYEKTERLRLKWNIQHEHVVKVSAQLTREVKGYHESDVKLKSILGGLPTLTRDSISGARNKKKPPIRDGVKIYTTADLKKGHSIVDVGLGNAEKDPRLARPDTDTKLDPVMRPVDPKERKIIYKGIPAHGRLRYIKTRNEMAPEDKYYFNETNGWTYGWRMRDSAFGRNAPAYGRVCLLTKGCNSRSGPQPDPEHYKELEQYGPNKC